MSAKTAKITAPMQAVVHALHISKGDKIRKGQEVVLLEAMKMH
ncbi:MAG: biotin/lipoyl-containing protein, partial [Gammaproteobacteria bacterium]